MKKSVLLALLLALSCSIKEDRVGCPCRLTVVLTEVGGVDGEDLVLGISGYPEERLSGARIPSRVERTVEKGVHRVSAFCGDERMILRSGVLTIPVGESCGRLMARAEQIECLGEDTVDTVRLRKQHIILVFRLEECNGIIVRSPWNGISVIDLSPAAGEYRTRAEQTGPGEFTAILPRQGDASMVADILGGDGSPVQTLPVGNMLRSAGYDFAAENLDDAMICLDRAPDGFSVTVGEWDESEAEEVNV